jgi:hypothetical protein
MKPLAGAEVSDFGTRFGFKAADGCMGSEPEAIAESVEESANASGSSPRDGQYVRFCPPA